MKSTSFIVNSTIIMAPIIAISSNSWIFLWILLEIGSMAFIMQIIFSTPQSKESAMKYFLIQSSASCILLMSILMKENEAMKIKMNTSIPSIIILVALAIKMATSPFHMWMPPIATKMSWNNLAIMLTWVKIAPLMIMMKTNLNNMILTLSVTSMIVGVISQFNLTSTKLIMAFSSISHLGWILTAVVSNMTIPMIYLLIYSTITISIMMIFKKNNTKSLIIQTNKHSNKYLTILILSLAGIPPLLGFLPKWMVLSNTQQKIGSLMILSTMILLASTSFYIYIRLVMSPMLNQTQNNNMKPNKTNNIKTMSFLNLSLPTLMIFLPK